MGVGLLVDTSRGEEAVEESEEAMRRHTEAERLPPRSSGGESKAAATLSRFASSWRRRAAVVI